MSINLNDWIAGAVKLAAWIEDGEAIFHRYDPDLDPKPPEIKALAFTHGLVNKAIIGKLGSIGEAMKALKEATHISGFNADGFYYAAAFLLGVPVELILTVDFAHKMRGYTTEREEIERICEYLRKGLSGEVSNEPDQRAS